MLSQSATITSKLQLTIPMRIAKKLGIKSGEKVQISEKDGKIVITPAKQLLSELEGVLALPKKWQGKDIDTIIQEAKREHFQDKRV